MLIVMSDAVERPAEAELINALFAAGMEWFHLRKPAVAASGIQGLLDAIRPEYRSFIALHSHHQLATAYGIKRLHFTEAVRTATPEVTLKQLRAEGFYLSTSTHHIADAVKVAPWFDHLFFGPVFNSISKQGYAAALPDGFNAPALSAKLIAIGGIDADNCAGALQMGFDGVAVLGAIWQEADPVKSFTQIKQAYHNTAHKQQKDH